MVNDKSPTHFIGSQTPSYPRFGSGMRCWAQLSLLPSWVMSSTWPWVELLELNMATMWTQIRCKQSSLPRQMCSWSTVLKYLCSEMFVSFRFILKGFTSTACFSLQEMLAIGCSNFLGSFFKIHVICCALSVTLAVDSAGGSSQVSEYHIQNNEA